MEVEVESRKWTLSCLVEVEVEDSSWRMEIGVEVIEWRSTGIEVIALVRGYYFLGRVRSKQ